MIMKCFVPLIPQQLANDNLIIKKKKKNQTFYRFTVFSGTSAKQVHSCCDSGYKSYKIVLPAPEQCDVQHFEHFPKKEN